MKKLTAFLIAAVWISLYCVPSSYAVTYYFWRYREHATSCPGITDGKSRDLCFEVDASTFYKCEPAAGDCDTAGEWKLMTFGITDVVDDTTPQLGGDLDLNSKNLDFPTTANISDVLDEDNMASNSATMLATQQSIKAYADSLDHTDWTADQGAANIHTGNYPISDSEVPNNITIDLSTLATTLTITDNENDAETNAVLFTANGALTGGNLGIESDGDLTYVPSTGTFSATVLTEGANAVYNSSETPGGELGGTWSSPTVDSGIHDDEYQPLDSELTTIAALGETTGNVMISVAGAWASVAQPVIDCTNCTSIPAGSSHSGTLTWSGTSILESGAAFQFGDGTDATVTHTYGNTGTDVVIAYSTAAMAVTGSLTATNLSGTNTGDNDEVGTKTSGDLCVNDGSVVNCTVNTESELETALDALDIMTVTSGDFSKANLETALSDVSNVAEADGDTYTGEHDFNAATFEPPNSAADVALADAGNMHFNTADEQLSFHSAADGEISGEASISLLRHLTATFDPAGWYDQESTYRVVPLMTVGDDSPEGVTIVEWEVDYVGGNPTTELDADIMCDTTADYNPAAGATVMDIIDTTTGASAADTGFDSATCANAAKMYVRFGADPTDANVIVQLDIWFYNEED